MGLQWTLIAGFLYAEVAIVLLLVLPVFSPSTWQKIFRSKFLQMLNKQASIYFLMVLGVLTLFLLDAIREMRKYSVDRDSEHPHLNIELQGNMRLFRSQRNFFICGFSLFLTLVIRRLVVLISAQATLMAQNEAAMRQAQSATTTARTLLSQKPGESAENDENHEKAITEFKNKIKELQSKNSELEDQLTKEKKSSEAMKSQAQSLAAEYDRLAEEHAKLVKGSGDKKSD